MSVWGWALPSTQALCPRPAKQLCGQVGGRNPGPIRYNPSPGLRSFSVPAVH